MSKKNVFQTEKINDFIVSWLREYAVNAKVKGFIIGISGGIDSAVTSTLCAQTGLPTLCLEMPIHQSENHIRRAKEHIVKLGKKFPNVTTIETNLSLIFDTFKNEVSNETQIKKEEKRYDLAFANVKSRLRMTTLYYYAGISNLLVVGTGNKVEDFGVGFYTKYGDGGVDISPIADLMKSEVYLLGVFLDIPYSILHAAPSDGLFDDDRSDEQQLGATYDELETAIIADKNRKTVADFTGREKEVFIIYKRLNEINQHKMTPIPVCKIPINLK